MEKIKLNKRIYSLKAIQQAIEAYKHLTKFSLHQDARYYNVIIYNIAADFKNILKDEFTNYVLAIVKDVH